MAKYIGQNLSHGVFTRQDIYPIRLLNGDIQDTYTLQHRVPNESSIIVACDKLILQPSVDYVIVQDSQSFQHKIKFNVDLAELDNVDGEQNNLKLYVLYLGKELLQSTIPSIDSIHDVTVTQPLAGQVLKYNGTGWVNADVSTIDPTPSIQAWAQNYITSRISEVVNGAPETLDTLKEIADALGEDENFSTTITNQLGSLNTRISTLESSPSTLDALSDVSITSASKGQFIVHDGTQFVNSNTIEASGAAVKPLIVKGAASQTANLLEINDNTNSNMLSVTPTGRVVISDKTVASTATTLLISSTNNSSRLITLRAHANQAANMLDIQNSSGTTISGIGANGQWYDDGMQVLAYRSYNSVTADGTNSTFTGIQPDFNSSSVWVNGTLKTRTTHYTLNGQWLQWTAGNAPSSGDTVEIFAVNNFWRSASGDGAGCGYFPVLSVNEKRFPSSLGTLHITAQSSTRKGLTVKAAASQTANLVEVQDSSGTQLASISSSGTIHATRYTETTKNSFATTLAPSSGNLTVDLSSSSAVLGTLSASVTKWAFTNVPVENNKSTTITVLLSGNASYTYGDACSVNGTDISGGLLWSGGTAPTATSGIDLLTFIVITDAAGTIKVLGFSTTNFS